MNNLYKYISVFVFSAFVPLVSFAQNSGGIKGLLDSVTNIIYGTFVPMLFAVALAIFLYGVVQYVMNGADESKREKGKQYMVWGIIGLTVMVSVWGLVALLGGTFGLDSNVVPQLRE